MITAARLAPLDSSSDEGTRHGTLCVTTFKRPLGLEQALRALQAMHVPATWKLDIVVVDNDPEGSAGAVVESARRRGLAVRYVVEPARGIPQVRNRSVAEAAGTDWLLFIDDDEAPAVDWLEQIDAAQRATDADVTVGPSEPRFDEEPARWIRRGRFFERRAGGSEGGDIPYFHARTSGVLIRIAAFTHLGPRPFDDGLALSSGEDRNFFAEIANAGCRIVWAPGAVVTEIVPASRATFGWLIRRHFRIGNLRSHTMLRVDHAGPARRAKRVIRGVLEIPAGLAQAALRWRPEERVRGLQRAACGAGLALGAIGYRYEEYKKTHGS